MRQKLLMRVEKSISLTGLGVLLLPQQPAPLLLDFDLHTQWVVRLILPDRSETAATVSIEEISRPTNSLEVPTAETRALLLTQEGTEPVPAGTLVYWQLE